MVTSNELKTAQEKRIEEEKWVKEQYTKLCKRYKKKFEGSEKELHFLLHKAVNPGSLEI